MTSTVQTYVGDGTSTLYGFNFDYLKKDFVKVTVEGQAVPFTFQSNYTVSITTAPADGAVIIIKRVTDRNRLVDFVDGSILRAGDLNVAQLQAIHIAAEAVDATGASMILDETGAYSAGFRRITNVGSPTGPNDAVTKAWSETALSSQLTQATAAKDAAVAAQGGSETARDASLGHSNTAATKANEASGSATLSSNWAEKGDGLDVNGVGTRSAKHHANAAGNSASVASGHATTAGTKATEASGHASTALAHRDAAQGFRNEAQTFRNEALGFRDTASTHATKADAWANTAKGVEVDTGKYSAKHYAETAADTVATIDVNSLVPKAGATLTGAFKADAPTSLGTVSTGTITLAPTGKNFQSVANGGAFSIAAPTAAGEYTLILRIWNSATAGTVTLTGFSKVTGDAITAGSGQSFLIYVAKTDGLTHANTVAMQ